jgi:hypothetical protein
MTFSNISQWRAGLGFLTLGGLVFLLAARKPWTIFLGDDLRFEDTVAYFIWFGVAAATVVSAGLAGLAGWWAERAVTGHAVGSPTPRWFWPCVALAMAFSAATSLPRLDYSLWDDEEFNARRSIVGFYKVRKEDGAPIKFYRADWTDAFFGYREPNNHIFNSVLAKAGHELWLALRGDLGKPFSEWPLRLPSFVFGVLSVATMAWMLKTWGWPGAGVLAAALFALHPWHVRYVAECRGYGIVLCFVPLVLGLWRHALIDGRWRWWAAFGTAQFFLLWTYPGVAFILIVLNVLSLPAILLGRESAGPRISQLGRWFCANACAALPTFVLFLPLIPQMREFMEHESSQGNFIGWPWVVNVMNHFLAGTAWFRNSQQGAEYPEILFAFRGMMPVYWSIACVSVAAAIFGSIRFMRSGFSGVVFVLATLLPPIITFCLARSRGHLIYEPYVIFALPGWVALIAVGCAWAVGAIPRPVPRISVALLLVAVFAWFTEGTRSWMRDNPLQPLKESALLTRGTLDPLQADSRVLTASFSIPPYLYDPLGLRVESTVQFLELLKQADLENRPLLVNIGMPWAAREFSPGLWSIVNDSSLFEKTAHLRGLDPGLDRILYRYKPGSAAERNFSDIPPR